MNRRQYLASGAGVGLLATGGYLFRKRGPYEVVSLDSTVERRAPDHRYTVTDSNHPEEDIEGKSILDDDDLPDHLTPVFDPTGDEYAADTLPDGTRQILSEYDLVDFGPDVPVRYKSFHIFEVDPDSPPRLALDAELLDSTAKASDPAVLEIRATNTGDEPFWLSTGVPAPFGVLEPEAGTAEPLLWTDAYEESGDVQTRRGRLVSRTDVAIGYELAPEESASEQYEIQPKRFAVDAGEYVLDQTFHPTFRDERRRIGQASVESRIRWELERRQPL